MKNVMIIGSGIGGLTAGVDFKVRPNKAVSYNRCESYLERSSQPLVASLGADRVT
jgi:thioredoxin reductase